MAAQAGQTMRERNSYSSAKFESFKRCEDETHVYSVYEEDRPTPRRAADNDAQAQSQPQSQRCWRPQTMSASATLMSSYSPGQQHHQQQSTDFKPSPAELDGKTNGFGWTPSPQRVRLVAGEIHQQRRSRPASADRFGNASQRASRASLGGAHSTGGRMGRFVNYYPASRQQSPGRHRQPSPYAFHVPRSHQRADAAYSQQQVPVYGNSRATSPSYAYANFNPTDNCSQADCRQEASPQAESPPHQRHYGYVAPSDRVPQSPPAGKFNKSLRSRTISHLPSMVQVSVEDDRALEKLLGPATSESDFLKRHVVVWRSNAELDHDNPFKPGTPLSWEADLMVRLIRRGYPIDQLPSLVEAAKLEAAARRTGNAIKSADGSKKSEEPSRGSPKGSGFLKSNLRHANQTRELANEAKNQRRPISGSVSHSNLASTKPGDLSAPAGRHQRPTTPSEGKAVWADSLRRANSMTRFRQADADSLDKLITSIELEIDELNASRDSSKTKRESETRAEAPDGSSKKPSPKKKRPSRQQVVDSDLDERAADQTREMTKKTRAKALATNAQISDQENSAGRGAREGKKKRRCCAIQ